LRAQRGTALPEAVVEQLVTRADGFLFSPGTHQSWWKPCDAAARNPVTLQDR